VTRSQETKKATLAEFIAQQTAPSQTIVRYGFKAEVESLIRAAYRLGYTKGKESRRGR